MKENKVLGDRYWSPGSGNGRQENIGWENFAQLTKTFAKLIQENNFLKIAKLIKFMFLQQF